MTSSEGGAPPPKKPRKEAEALAQVSGKNPSRFTTHTAGHEPYDVDVMRKPKPAEAATKTIVSWNVAGLRAFLKKATDDLKLLSEKEAFDVMVIQEHKLQESHVSGLQQTLESDVFGDAGYHYYWNCSTEKKGYSGVAIISRTKPLSVDYGIEGLPSAEAEGRVIVAEYEDFYLVNVYVPNSGSRPLDWRVGEWDEKFSAYVKGLQASKPVIVAGDMNCAAEPIDIHSPKTNLKSAGYTPEERASFASRDTWKTASWTVSGGCTRRLWGSRIGGIGATFGRGTWAGDWITSW